MSVKVEEKRIALMYAGHIDPDRIDDYIEAGGYQGLKKALASAPAEIIDMLVKVMLRGRGGAGFPAGLKERFAEQSPGEQKYIVCNGDEGEPGTFKDRIIMEQEPFVYLEGMTIAAYAIGASRGYVYIRGEYHRSIERTIAAIDQARKGGFLGKDIQGTDFSFDIEVRIGAGSYLVGEELTLLESLEGKRGYPRIKPPFPSEKGLFGRPTLLNNVETFANIPAIITGGPDWYLIMGTEASPGTKIFCVSGDVAAPGFFEAEMSITLRDLIFGFAKGMRRGREFKAALLGGAAGTFVDESFLDAQMAFDTLQERGATLGSGAVIVMGSGRSIFSMLHSILRFFEHESCGKCVPCRVGMRQLLREMDALKRTTHNREIFLDRLVLQAEQMAKSSLCPLGKSPILPVASAVHRFRDELSG
jgi:NADH:ubiquinone oxidoreductase subunit F (NADH-binding)